MHLFWVISDRLLKDNYIVDYIVSLYFSTYDAFLKLCIASRYVDSA